MSFAREIKDFTQGYDQGETQKYQRARENYYESRADLNNRKPGDPNGDWLRWAMQNPDSMGDGGSDDAPAAAPAAAVPPPTQAIPTTTTGGATPATQAAVAASPVVASQAAAAVPAAAYAGANTGTRTAALDTGSDARDMTGQSGYARGGVVRGYDDGGAVQPDEQSQDMDGTGSPTPPPPAPSQQAAPAAAAPAPPPGDQPTPPAALPTGDQSAPPPADNPNLTKGKDGDGSILGDVVHAGLSKLKEIFGLDQNDAAVGAGPGLQQRQKAFMSGAGPMNDDLMSQVRKAMDPKGNLTQSQLSVKVMEGGYRYYMLRGEPDKADNFAASVMQYSSSEAAKYGQRAAQLMQEGKTDQATKFLQKAYNLIPNGKGAENIKVNPDGTATVDETDITGKVVGQHTLSGQDMLNGALGLANKSGYWQQLMQAASHSNYAPPNEAYESALQQAQGLPGKGAAPASAQGQASVQGQAPSQAPVTPPGNQPPAAAPAVNSDGTINAGYYSQMRAKESSGRTSIQNGGSAGLNQFTVDQWKTATGQDIPPNVVGTAQDPRLNAAANNAAMVKSTQLNAGNFHKLFGQAPTMGDLAVMHQQGFNGGTRLIRAAQTAPDTPAVQVLVNAGVSRDRAIASLVGNKVPPNATAAQAVASIKGYYFGGQSGASANANVNGNAAPATGGGQGPFDLLPASSEDKLQAVAPPDPVAPVNAANVDPSSYQYMDKTQAAQVKAIAQAHNAAEQKRFTEDTNTSKANYLTRLANAKAAHETASAPLKLSPNDSNAISTSIGSENTASPSDSSGAIGTAAADKDSSYSQLAPSTRKAVPVAAFALKAQTQSFIPTKRWIWRRAC